MQAREQTHNSHVAYDPFASAYDNLFAPEAAEASVATLDRLLFADLPAGSRILDLCCGSGRLTRQLVDRGFHVVAVDGSAEMLVSARQRVPEATFVQCDVRDLHLDRNFDAVVSTYNSLPHITEPSDLARVFCAVRRSLRPGGKFVFDVYSSAAYEQLWRGCFAKVDDECVCIVRASYDAERRQGRNLITVFQKNRTWERADVDLITRSYTKEELNAWLTAAGFVAVEACDGTQRVPSDEFVGRVFWSCRTP